MAWKWTRLTATAAGLAAFAGPALAGIADLAPHRAVYDLALSESDSDTNVSSIFGRLVMEFTGSACAGYTNKIRFVTETEDPEGARQITDTRSSTFEAGDGRRLDFSYETYTGETLAEESKGTASRSGSTIGIALSKPASKKLSLSSAVVFPTEQMERILDSARKGESFLHLDFYDGSEDGTKVFETAGVIGPPSTASDDVGDEAVVREAGIAGLRHWPLTLSYFDKAKEGDDTPFYVMSFIIYENGVGRTLKIDYGDFALSGRLTGLSMLPSAPCP